MKKVVIVRYGELYLKGKNRNYFESVLISNIKKMLANFEFTFKKTSGRYVIENFNENDENQIVNKLKKVFGLVSLSRAYEVDSNIENICDIVKTFRFGNGSFRTSVKRADKSFELSSINLERMLGGVVLENNKHLKVDLKYFDYEVCVDIRENGKTYIFESKESCAQGMPLGTAGRGVLLLSGGIDSPVSAYLMAKRGLSLLGLHFYSFPYTSEAAKQKVIDLGKKIKEYTGKFKIIMFPFTEIQEEIHKHCKSEYMITIMRRIMMKVSAKVAEYNHCKAIVTGENLGQVASQTVESLTVSNFSQTQFPIFRPLIAYDKFEIVDIAKKIDTYDLSILPYEDCCTVFLPKSPIIKPKMDKTVAEENKLDVENLIAKAFEKIEIVEC